MRRISFAVFLFTIPASALGAEPWEAAPSFEARFLSKARPKRTKRVVTVAPSVTELLFALGVGDRVVGVSRFDDYPPSVKALPKVGGFLDPNPEAILALDPDLVIGVPNAGNRPALERVAKLGVPVLIVPGNAFPDVFHAIREVAPIFGKSAVAKGRALESEIAGELTRLSRSVASREPVKVAIVYGWNPLVVAGPGSFADTILRALNAKNVVEGGSDYPHWSNERLVESQPEVIIDATGPHRLAGGKPWARFTTVPAVANDRVHRLSLDVLLRPGPRLVEGMRVLRRLLHPETELRSRSGGR